MFGTTESSVFPILNYIIAKCEKKAHETTFTVNKSVLIQLVNKRTTNIENKGVNIFTLSHDKVARLQSSD